MTELRIGDQLIDFDREATLLAHSTLDHGGADRCSCSGCRNFVLLRDRAYPEPFLLFLKTLGIDPNKEGEAVLYGPKDGLYLYGGWFYFVGEVVEAGQSCMRGGEGFRYWINSTFPQPPAVFGKKVAAIEFITPLPWVLKEPWDPIAKTQMAKAEEIMNRYPKALQKLANSE